VPSSAIVSPATVDHTRGQTWLSSPIVLLTITLGLLWFIVCRHLSAEWSYNEQYNYGWFVPFFALYLFWMRWEDRPPAAPTREIRHSKFEIRNLIALAIAVPALLLLFPLRLIEVANPDWRLLSWAHTIAAVTLTLVLVWWMGGKPWLRHFAFPILFVLVAVPWITGIEQPIIQGLMPLVASIATETLSLFGIPAEVQGNLIRISDGVVGVSEACSGVRSLQTSLMIGLLFGELTRLSVSRRLLLIAAAIAIAFLANCGRAFFLVWIAATRGVPEVEHWHDYAGYAIVGLVFFGCLAVAKFLGAKAESGKTEKLKSPSDSQLQENSSTSQRLSSEPSSFSVSAFQRFSFPTAVLTAALAWMLATELGCEAWYRAHERNLQRTAQWNVRWPETAPGFRQIPIDEQTRTVLHHDEGRGATWHGSGQPAEPGALTTVDTISLLYFFRWHPGHNSALLANAHRPDVCLPASGWKQTGDFGVKEYPVAGNLVVPFRHFVFTNEAPGRTRYAHAFYCVWEDRVAPRNGETATSAISENPSDWSRSERIGAVAQGRRHLGQQVMEYLLIEGREIPPAEAEEMFAATVRELVSPIAPQS
jgi:exosortase